MRATGSRLAPGDVLEVTVPGGRGLVQYIGEHSELSGTIWVVPQVLRSETTGWSEELAATGYYAFFPARTAVRKGLAKIVDKAGLNGRAIPVATRRAGAINSLGEVLNWVISDQSGQRLVDHLPLNKLALPIEEIWNLEMLALRIAEGWRPAEAASFAVDQRIVNEDQRPDRVVHYLYFSDAAHAEAARQEILGLSFKLELRPAAMGSKWLLKATSSLGTAIQDRASQTETLQDVASRLDGEYDGWEQGV
jgi:hypothetical protein